MRAGVFDSGVGGITVLKSILEAGFFDEIIYYGDTARVPYGVKDKNTIIRYSLETLEFFKNFDVDIIIAACNTVSAYAINELRESAWCDVVGVIDPGVASVINKLESRDANILVLGTKATVNSKRYKLGLEQAGYRNITQIATSLFIPIVEEGIFQGEVLDSALKFYLEGIQPPEAIILGCTHFPLISEEVAGFFPNQPLVIHSGEAIAEYLEQKGLQRGSAKNSKVKYFASENPEGLKEVARKWLKK
ncbi:MAG: glutamate racemase [Campylobacterales bacterium]